MKSTPISIFWFRRDLRLNDNAGLYHALKGTEPVLPLFIFDSNILDDLKDTVDQRIVFIHRQLQKLHHSLIIFDSALLVRHGNPDTVWKELLQEFKITDVYANHDYEPYAKKRDKSIGQLLSAHGISFHTFNDQVIFEKEDVVKENGRPYTVFTPYKNKWKSLLKPSHLKYYDTGKHSSNFVKWQAKPIPGIEEIGFGDMDITFPKAEIPVDIIKNYHKTRDYPAVAGTTRLGLHLRFGTMSIRNLVRIAIDLNETWLDELIWREFFMSILHHFPQVVDQPFKPAYADIPWRDDQNDFERWRQGQTGYPLVDAGMRELNATGFMHNRVRMVTASFLTKHLLLNWLWGERYFAEKLLDYDLSANNGNWQWAAGCGCDAAPYFRVFNPIVQAEKFDSGGKYIKKWVPEVDTADYPRPMVPHAAARIRAINTYKQVLKDNKS